MNLFEIYKNTFTQMPTPEFCANLPVALYPFYLKRIYKYKTGRKLNLRNPQTYCEKIQWLKLYDSTETKTKLADKLAVREYVAEKIGTEYLKPIFKIYNSFEEVDFNELPEFFVMKTNHACATNSARKKSAMSAKGLIQLAEFYKQKLQENYAFHSGFELQYKNIEPKLFVEKYIAKLTQYSILCFNGVPEYIHVEEPKPEWMASAWYDLDFKLQPFDLFYYHEQILPTLDTKVAKQAVDCAQELCKGLSFVRCDFAYSHKYNKLYFEELTFTPSSGFSAFNPYEWELKLGKKIPINI